ncbi:MAG: ABC transporter permease [Candidatus Hydrogenedentota bacterium]
MRNVWALCRREFAAYFLTPVGYVTVGIFAVLAGVGFRNLFFEFMRVSQEPSKYGYTSVPDFEEYFLNPFLTYCAILVMFLAPLITMRLLAEEKHRGTVEQLYTLPLREYQIVFGKYLAAVGMVLVMMLVIGVDLAVVGWFTAVEPLILAAGLLSVFLMGLAFLALGLFVSALSRNQMSAGTLTFGLSLLFFFISDMVAKLPRPEDPAGTTDSGLARAGFIVYDVFLESVGKLAADAHVKDMTLGVLNPEDVAFYLLFAAFFLFLTFRALESRFWRA